MTGLSGQNKKAGRAPGAKDVSQATIEVHFKAVRMRTAAMEPTCLGSHVAEQQRRVHSATSLLDLLHRQQGLVRTIYQGLGGPLPTNQPFCNILKAVSQCR